ncbi:hypothetical protein [uncultured Metabacillus sp.]|nr:hypothetical protein [uncultured Metabacillus sp.]
MSRLELKDLLKDYYPFTLLTDYQLQEMTYKAKVDQLIKMEQI